MRHSANSMYLIIFQIDPLLKQVIINNISSFQKIVIGFKSIKRLGQISRKHLNLSTVQFVKKIFVVRSETFFKRIDLVSNTVNSGKQHRG